MTVNLDLSPLGGGASAAVSASATLASGGSVTLPTGTFEAVGFHIALTGGTGSGTPGGTMGIALAEIKLDVPALATITCLPQCAQTVIDVLPLAANPPVPTPGGGGGMAGAATAVTGRRTHAG